MSTQLSVVSSNLGGIMVEVFRITYVAGAVPSWTQSSDMNLISLLAIKMN